MRTDTMFTNSHLKLHNSMEFQSNLKPCITLRNHN